MKLYQIESIYQSLTKLLTKELPIKTSYKLSKLGKQVFEEFKTFQEIREKMINKYADRDEEDNIIDIDGKVTILSDNIDKFNKEINELMDIDISFNFEGVSIEELGEIEISGIDLLNLEDFIVE